MSRKDTNKGTSIIEPQQVNLLAVSEIIHSVITLKEASEILNVSESTLRTRVIKGEFKEWEYRKSGGTILFYKAAVINRVDSFRKRKSNNN